MDPAQSPALAAVKTYRYLRLALVGLVVLLFASLTIEWLAVGRDCLQPTISSYWHTPVRGVLVGVLVTMGICLIALKGSTEPEDVLLNLAGILAPGVAFIPTATYTSCSSVVTAVGDLRPAIGNNMQALFVLGVVAVAVALVLAARERGGLGRLSRWERGGIALGLAATAGGAAWFYLARSSFVARGHDVAAVGMFLAIVAVVWVNSRDLADTEDGGARPRGPYVAAYRVIAVAMLLVLALAVVGHLADWSGALLAVELGLISLFGLFWVLQTRELWHQGLRHPGPAEGDRGQAPST